MEKKILHGIAALMLCFMAVGLQAQNAISACGGDASGSGGNVSYTIGQVAYTSQSGPEGSISQGIQQAYNITVVSETENSKKIQINVSAYPNPTSDYLILNITGCETEGFLYQLFNNNGKLLDNKMLQSNSAVIDMQNCYPATYFVKIFKQSQEIKTFKIIKIE